MLLYKALLKYYDNGGNTMVLRTGVAKLYNFRFSALLALLLLLGYIERFASAAAADFLEEKRLEFLLLSA